MSVSSLSVWEGPQILECREQLGNMVSPLRLLHGFSEASPLPHEVWDCVDILSSMVCQEHSTYHVTCFLHNFIPGASFLIAAACADGEQCPQWLAEGLQPLSLAF